MITTLSIVIPAYNEEPTIHLILDKVCKVRLPGDLKKEIIIVDDCSKDNTYATIQKYIADYDTRKEIQLFKHEKNAGKGAALHTGIAKATGEVLVIQDADLEYDPNEYALLLQPILDNVADVVYGSRFIGGKPHRILFFWHTLGNKFLTFLSNMFTNLNLTDMETCYKAFRREVLQSFTLKEDRFGIEPELTARVGHANVRVYEVPISYFGRTYEEGKKIGWKDGVRALYAIGKYGLLKR